MKLFKKNEIDKVSTFLTKFPDIEFWRFVMERSCYNLQAQIYDDVFNMIDKNPANPLIASYHQLSFNEKINAIDSIKIRTLLHLATDCNDNNLLAGLVENLQVMKDPDRSVGEYLLDHRGWLHFEYGEKGYLQGTAKGFNYIFEALAEKKELTVNFLKELNSCCTTGVTNMIKDHKPGEIRTNLVSWRLFPPLDTKEGLIEIFYYLDLVNGLGKPNDVFFLINPRGKPSYYIDINEYRNPHQLATEIMGIADSDIPVRFVCESFQDSGLDLENLLQEQIKALEAALHFISTSVESSKSESQKLKAIFTFIKFSVLHHPFTDGVGRTFSMILMQYLLMRENLFPFLIQDSNCIPGYSIQELIDEYYESLGDLRCSFRDPNYLSELQFARYNIDTNELQSSLTNDQKEYFDHCVEEYHQGKQKLLAAIGHSTHDQDPKSQALP